MDIRSQTRKRTYYSYQLYLLIYLLTYLNIANWFHSAAAGNSLPSSGIYMYKN